MTTKVLRPILVTRNTEPRVNVSQKSSCTLIGLQVLYGGTVIRLLGICGGPSRGTYLVPIGAFGTYFSERRSGTYFRIGTIGTRFRLFQIEMNFSTKS